jgi:hypothetical protein
VCSLAGSECGGGNSFCNCFPGGVFKGNVFADNLGAAAGDRQADRYPGGNYFVSSYQKIGFTDFAGGVWSLDRDSRTRGRATDGRDPGVDFDALVAAGALSAREGRRIETR